MTAKTPVRSSNNQNEILEDYEPLLELRTAYAYGDSETFEGVLSEISAELADEYRAKIEEKVKRWASATAVLHLEDTPPTRTYIQAKMLYRDGFYEATIMICRSIAEMFCYDRLGKIKNPFGSRQEIEKKNFRELVRWLYANDPPVNEKVFDNLNMLYDLGQQLHSSKNRPRCEG